LIPCRAIRQGNIEFAKSILSNDFRARRTAIERSERAQIHCHPHRLVVIEPVSANRLHKNGNFCGLGWRLSANSRQGCHFYAQKAYQMRPFRRVRAYSLWLSE
jgi:hypothetical protein